MTISVVPAALHDVAVAGKMFVELVNDIINVVPAHWIPSADLHPDASLFVVFALVATFVAGQRRLSEEAEDIDLEAPVLTPVAEEENVPAPLPSRPAPASPDLIRVWRKAMKEASKRKAERLRARSVRQRSARRHSEESNEPGDVQETPVQPEVSSVPLAPTSRYVDVGVQTDVTVGATPEPVHVAAELETVTEQQTTESEVGPLEVAELPPTSLAVVGVEDHDILGVSTEETVVSSSEDQLREGSPNGVSGDGESTERESEGPDMQEDERGQKDEEEEEYRGEEEQEQEQEQEDEEEEEQEQRQEDEDEDEEVEQPQEQPQGREILRPRSIAARLARILRQQQQQQGQEQEQEEQQEEEEEEGSHDEGTGFEDLDLELLVLMGYS
ncbi:hypothetical protein TWF281_003349 [Arthrobotrys megalospora]